MHCQACWCAVCTLYSNYSLTAVLNYTYISTVADSKTVTQRKTRNISSQHKAQVLPKIDCYAEDFLNEPICY